LGIGGCGFSIHVTVWSKFFRFRSPISDGPIPPPWPFAPWQLEQLFAKICLPLPASPLPFAVVAETLLPFATAAGDGGFPVTPGAPAGSACEGVASVGADDCVVDVVVVLEFDDSLFFEQALAVATTAAASTSADSLNDMRLLSAPTFPEFRRLTRRRDFARAPRTRSGVSRVFIRYALARDVDRLVADRVVTGPTPNGEPWSARVQKWHAEQLAGRRLILVAEGGAGLLGMVQLVFRFPPGYTDAEAANGVDVAMVETLRTRADAPPGVATQLITDVQNIARKRSIKTITFLLPMNDQRAIAQAKSWGFVEFRIMPEPGRMLAFFRKSVD